MSEEIKEILEDVKRHLDYVEATKQSSIRDNEMKAMYDCITSLQEENEYSNHCNEELRKKITNLEYKIERLEENNKHLKELCNKYEEEHKTTFEEWKKDIEANKKAIEYINEMCLCSDGYANYGDDLRPEYIINILQGDNK